MFNSKAAEVYQQISSRQREYGKRLIESEVKPCLGAAILDLGCGTGELSAYLAELVGQTGNVLGVDPDIERLKLAQESHKGIENLKFVEASASDFPGMASETYNIIFSNHVLHWVEDKERAFKNMFDSLKPAGKIVMEYGDRSLTTYDRVFRELNPENFDRLHSSLHIETRPAIEQMCIAAGFNILKSCTDTKAWDLEFKNIRSLLSFFWGSTQGVFDPRLVTDDRVAKFCAQYSSGDGEVKICAGEHDFHSTLIAVKPAKT